MNVAKNSDRSTLTLTLDGLQDSLILHSLIEKSVHGMAVLCQSPIAVALLLVVISGYMLFITRPWGAAADEPEADENQDPIELHFRAAEERNHAHDYVGAVVLFDEVIQLAPNYQLAIEYKATIVDKISDEDLRIYMSSNGLDWQSDARPILLERIQRADASRLIMAEQREARTVCGRDCGPWMPTCKKIGSGIVHLISFGVSALGVLGAGVLLGGAAVLTIKMAQ